MAKKSFGWIKSGSAQVRPTWGRVTIEQIVIFCGVEVHDDSSTIKKLFVTAGTGNAVVAVSAVASVEQLLRLHLATQHPKKTATQTERVKSCDSTNCQRLAIIGIFSHYIITLMSSEMSMTLFLQLNTLNNFVLKCYQVILYGSQHDEAPKCTYTHYDQSNPNYFSG